ncbi:MAG: YihY/virulence factor BrkB family protein [Saprospiraceae bacterium]
MVKKYVEQLIAYFNEHPLLTKVLDWMKAHSFPGLQRIPIYHILKFIQQELKNDALVIRANSMAFSFFLSIFPAIIVLFTLLAYTPLYDNFDVVLRNSITEIMPGNAGNMLFKTIENIATIPRSGLLSFGFFLAIWFASNGMLTMMRGLEKGYKEAFKRRNALEKRLIAIQLTFLLALILVASVLLIILGNTLLSTLFSFVRVDFITRWSVFAFRWIVIFALFYAGISTIYRYGSSTRRKIPFFNPGAMLSTLFSIITSWGFSFYVDNFGTYNKVYGSIGTLIVMMVWLQINCMIVLIGFELNASIVVLRARRKSKAEAMLKMPEDQTRVPKSDPNSRFMR